MGKRASTIIITANIICRCTSLEERIIILSILLLGFIPANAIFRIIASTITTDASIINPKSTAPKDNKLAGIPIMYIQIKAKNNENGIAIAVIRAERQFPNNIVKISKTTIIPSSNVVTTVCIVKSTNSVLS